MALGSTQLLTEINTRIISLGEGGVKCGQCVRLTNYHFRVPIVLTSGSLNVLEPLRNVQACTGIALPSLPTSLAVLNQVLLNEGRLMMMYASSLQTVM